MVSPFTKSFYLLLVLIFFGFVAYSEAAEPEFAGEVSLENRYFLNDGQYGNEEHSDVSLSIAPEYSFSWDNDRKVVVIIPYAIVNTNDDEKTHVDLREASIVSAYDYFEIRAGVSKIFWGVTESQHLVDVVNQSDTVLNVDGEDKLGQPMVNLNIFTDYGNLDLFLLPYFRERTFSGNKGRFRGPLLVDVDKATYEHKDEEKHIDVAGRYSKTIGDGDIGLSVFKGTDREPIFTLSDDFNRLVPKYIQTLQMGIDLQYIYESWLFKAEGINKQSDLREDYTALTYGFEYTFSNIKSSGIDVGIIVEELYDSRKTGAIFTNHTFLGSRVALNDEKSTELLAGVIVDNEKENLNSLRLETSRRINENWKWELEASAIIDTDVSDTLNTYRSDDYLQFSLSYFF